MSLARGLWLGTVRGLAVGGVPALLVLWRADAAAAALAFELFGLSALVAATVESVATARVLAGRWSPRCGVASLAGGVFVAAAFPRAEDAA